MACGDPQAAPRIALLDPTLTLTMPRLVTACTGLDAVGHAVETMVTTRRNAVSRVFSREAFRLANAALPRVLQDPGDLAARGDMLLAACFAGLAIENSMLGAAHSLANPLTARLGLAHGEAVGLMLPRVVRFNAMLPAAAEGYAELAAAAGLADAAALASRLDELLDLCGFDRALKGRGLDLARLPALAAEAARQWTAQFNPRPVSVADFEMLLRAS
jgi:alcohol dehydrogenase